MTEQRHEIAKSQSLHRQDLERRVVYANVTNERVGQVLAFILAAGTIALGGVLAWNGKETSGLAAIVSPLIGLVAVFLLGRRRQRKELDRKREGG